MEELRGAGLNKLTRVWVVVRTHPPTRTPFPPFPPFPPRVPASVHEQHVSAPPCTSRTSSWWQRCCGSPGGFLFYSNLIECGAGRGAAAAAPLAGKPAPRCAFRHTPRLSRRRALFWRPHFKRRFLLSFFGESFRRQGIIPVTPPLNSRRSATQSQHLRPLQSARARRRTSPAAPRQTRCR